MKARPLGWPRDRARSIRAGREERDPRSLPPPAGRKASARILRAGRRSLLPVAHAWLLSDGWRGMDRSGAGRSVRTLDRRRPPPTSRPGDDDRAVAVERPWSSPRAHSRPRAAQGEAGRNLELAARQRGEGGAPHRESTPGAGSVTPRTTPVPAG